MALRAIKSPGGVKVIAPADQRAEAIEAFALYFARHGRGNFSPEELRALIMRDMASVARRDGRAEFWVNSI